MHKVEIRVNGYLDEGWSDWVGGLSIHHSEGDETILKGCVLDQAALYGIISRLRDLGLPLNSVISESIDNDHTHNLDNSIISNERK
jgi:hypothetical protein